MNCLLQILYAFLASYYGDPSRGPSLNWGSKIVPAMPLKSVLAVDCFTFDNSQLLCHRPCQPQWACPNCRVEYAIKQLPHKYTCFCGKREDPTFDPWLAPHSCGLVCERPHSCGHLCNQLCHPSRCPPCPRMIEARLLDYSRRHSLLGTLYLQRIPDAVALHLRTQAPVDADLPKPERL